MPREEHGLESPCRGERQGLEAHGTHPGAVESRSVYRDMATAVNSSASLEARRGRVRRRYHFGQSGVGYIAITMLVALGAFNSQNNLLYWTFGFALALLLVSGVVSGTMLMGLRVERAWVSGAAEGEPVRIRYQVRNINRLVPAFALKITEVGFEDAVPKPQAWYARLLRRATPVVRDPMMRTPFAFVAHVGAGETVFAESRAIALRRGAVHFSELVVTTAFPFGLMRKSVHVPQQMGTVFTPRVAATELEPSGGSTRQGSLGGSSRRSGHGDEFFALREYSQGDSPRDIAWRASAKRGSLLVRQFAAPSPRRVWIVLHLRTRKGFGAADEQAIRMAAGLAHAAERQGVEYGLAVPLTRLLVHPRRSEGHLARLMTDLGLLDLGADDGRGQRAAFPAQAAGSGSNSSCIAIHAGVLDLAFAPASRTITNIVATAPMGTAGAANAVTTAKSEARQKGVPLGA